MARTLRFQDEGDFYGRHTNAYSLHCEECGRPIPVATCPVVDADGFTLTLCRPCVGVFRETTDAYTVYSVNV